MVTPGAMVRGIFRWRTPARFIADRRGMSAVEFGMLLPFLVLIAFGTLEVSDGFAVKRKLTDITSTMGDLVAQSKVITNTDMANILDASSAIIWPYNGSTLKIIVSGVTIDTNNNAKVTWSDARNTTPLPVNSPYLLPPDLVVPNTFLVVAEITYTYTPTVAYVLSGDINMSDRFFLKPRLSTTVLRTP